MSVSLKQIEAFVWVTDLGSFRRAADRLNTTQPNISARIAGLERALNLRLLERDAGSVQLTRRGKQLLPYARAVLSGIDDLLEATGNSSLIDGTIRLGVTEIIANVWLSAFLRALNERFPSVIVELTVDFSAALTEGLVSHDLDLALQSAPFDRDVSGNVPLQQYPMVWVAAPSYDLGRRTLSLADIAQYPVLTAATGTQIHRELTQHFNEARLARAKIAPSTNLAACVQMAVDGLGIGCVPRVMASDALAAGHLDELHYPWLPSALHFFARYDATRAAAIVQSAALLAAEVSGEHRT